MLYGCPVSSSEIIHGHAPILSSIDSLHHQRPQSATKLQYPIEGWAEACWQKGMQKSGYCTPLHARGDVGMVDVGMAAANIASLLHG